MLVFAAVLLLVALIIYSGDTSLVRTMRFTKVKDKKKYAQYLGKSLALVALALILSGIAGLFLPVIVSVILLVVLIVAAIIFIAKNAKDLY